MEKAQIPLVALTIIGTTTGVLQAQEPIAPATPPIIAEGDPESTRALAIVGEAPGPPLVEARFATPLVLPAPAQPLERPSYWVTGDDYPMRALRDEREGQTRVRLTIDENGLVSNCSVIASSGHKDLDDAACRTLKRKAAFVPAFDAEGNAITGTYSAAVSWKIPEVPKRALPASLKNRGFVRPTDYPLQSWQAGEEGRVAYAVDVDVDGKPSNCRITESSGFETLDAATCPLVLERAMFRPANSAEGTRVASIYNGSTYWSTREPEITTMTIAYRYLSRADGTTSQCEILKLEGGVPESMRREIERDVERGSSCTGPGNAREVPYRDENGVPVAKRVTVSFETVVEDVEQ